MITITREKNQSIQVGADITISIKDVRNGEVSYDYSKNYGNGRTTWLIENVNKGNKYTNSGVSVTVVDIRSKKVTLGIKFYNEKLPVYRGEVYDNSN